MLDAVVVKRIGVGVGVRTGIATMIHSGGVVVRHGSGREIGDPKIAGPDHVVVESNPGAA